MTVQADDRRKEYAGNGVTVAFTGPRALLPSQVKIYLEATPPGATIPVSVEQASGFAISGYGRDHTTVTFDVAPPDGTTIVILRVVPYEQQLDITNQDAYLPETLEHAGLDTQEFQIQQLADRISRALLGSDGSSDAAWNFDAQGRRIINLGTGVNFTDAVNLQQLLVELEQAMNGGPSYGVTPKLWRFDGDGVATDFAIPGADVLDSTFYDVVFNDVPQEPDVDYSIIVDDLDLDTYANSAIRFPAPLANGQHGWVVLRGYARSVSLGDPITTLQLLDYLRIRVVTEAGAAFTVSATAHARGLVRCTSAIAVAPTIRKNTGDPALDWKVGDYFSLSQIGDGGVTPVLPAGVTIGNLPAGYLGKPRAKGCAIHLVCVDADNNVWHVSGDMAIDGATMYAASAVTIADAGGYFAATDVEGALQTLGASRKVAKKLAAPFVSNVLARADVTGWTFPVLAGRQYRVEVVATYQTAGSAVGGSIGIGATGGAAGTFHGYARGDITNAAAATALAVPIVSAASFLTTTGTFGAGSVPHSISMLFVVDCTANGTLAIQWASEVAANNAQLNAGSMLFVEDVTP